MADLFWLGGTTAVAQVDRFTPANVEVDDVFTLTVTGQDGATNAVSFTATATTVANVTAGLTAAWNASTHRLCTPITAADATTSMTLTADTAGQPFSVASTTTDGGGSNTQTLTRLAVTASAGPYDWNTTANWSTGSKPVNSDNVTIDARGSAYSILYGLNQSAVTVTTLNIYKGAPQIGDTNYMLRIGATTANIMLPPNDGTAQTGNFTAINFGSVQTACNVYDSGNTGLSGLQPVVLGGTNASNVLNMYAGVAGWGTFAPSQSGTILTINLDGGTLTTGTGTDWTTIVNNGGTITAYKGSASGTLTTISGKSTIFGSAAIATVNANGGITNLNNRTTAATALNLNGGIVDFTGNAAAATVTTPTYKDAGGTVMAISASQVTYTDKWANGLTARTKITFSPG